MRHTFIHSFFIENSDVRAVKDGTNLLSDKTVYEVLRVISGVPLFYEDHWSRLQNSLQLAGFGTICLSVEEFRERIYLLCSRNNIFFGNVELRVLKDKTGNVSVVIGFSKHNYPQPLDYLNGVKLGLVKAERENPNAKLKNIKAREEANRRLKDSGLYEVLLVNSNNLITEGSRSTVFFIKGNTVITAPVEYVLPGVTRKYVIKVIKDLEVNFEERLVSVSELKDIDAVFICGTSPGVLPVSSVEQEYYNIDNRIIKSIIRKFNDVVNNYISSRV